MKTTLLTTFAAATSLVLCGCTTTPVLRPPSAKLRDNLGRVAVVAQSNAARIRYQVPDSKADVAGGLLLPAKTSSDNTVRRPNAP